MLSLINIRKHAEMQVWKTPLFQCPWRNEGGALFEVQDWRDDRRREQEMPMWKTTIIQHAGENDRRVLHEVQGR